MRRFAPATARNREVIFNILHPELPEQGTIFEIASGSGEHAAFMAPKLPDLHWQPSDIETDNIASINAWRTETEADNILPAQHFNVLENSFEEQTLPSPLAAILAINLVHISPWSVTEALIEKAGQTLPEAGLFYLYGPYKRDGQHTSASNEQFEAWLKAKDEQWGVRDMEAVIELAENAGFPEPKVTAMPANNFSLVFRR